MLIKYCEYNLFIRFSVVYVGGEEHLSIYLPQNYFCGECKTKQTNLLPVDLTSSVSLASWSFSHLASTFKFPHIDQQMVGHLPVCLETNVWSHRMLKVKAVCNLSTFVKNQQTNLVRIKLLQEGSLGKYSSIPLKALVVSYVHSANSPNSCRKFYLPNRSDMSHLCSALQQKTCFKHVVFQWNFVFLNLTYS